MVQGGTRLMQGRKHVGRCVRAFFPTGIAIREPQNGQKRDFCHKISQFWTPGAIMAMIGGCMEMAFMAPSQVVPCIWV